MATPEHIQFQSSMFLVQTIVSVVVGVSNRSHREAEATPGLWSALNHTGRFVQITLETGRIQIVREDISLLILILPLNERNKEITKFAPKISSNGFRDYDC